MMASRKKERRRTEQRNAASKNLDRMTAGEIVRLMNREDRKVAVAVGRESAAIGRAVDAIVRGMRKGGRLIYVTCSLLDEEGVEQAEGFIRRHPHWTQRPPELPAGRPRGNGIRLTPLGDKTDGFFIARFDSP